MAILNVLTEIIEKLDKNEAVAGLYFDLSKAFDTIDHPLLLKKLESCGVRGVALKLLGSYLENRHQLVSLIFKGKNYSSGSTVTRRGVPQGSILGPLLFLLYVNDLPDSLRRALVCQFADDTSAILAQLGLADKQRGLC